jgi:hypothetical protein
LWLLRADVRACLGTLDNRAAFFAPIARAAANFCFDFLEIVTAPPASFEAFRTMAVVQFCGIKSQVAA